MNNDDTANKPDLDQLNRQPNTQSTLQRMDSLQRDLGLSNSYDEYTPNGYSGYAGDNYRSYSGYGNQSTYGNYGSYGGYSGGYGRGMMGGGYNGYSYGQRQNPEQANPNMPPQRPIMQFRQDIWGFLNGAHSILNVAYAGSGILAFGHSFLKATIGIFRFLTNKSVSFLLKITGIYYLRKLFGLAKNQHGNWNTELLQEGSMDALWGEKASKFGLRKILNIMRILAMAGLLLSWIAKRRERRRAEEYIALQMANKENSVQIEEEPLEEVMAESTNIEQQEEVVVIQEEAENEELLNAAFEEAKKEVTAAAADENNENTNNETIENVEAENIENLQGETVEVVCNTIEKQEEANEMEDNSTTSLKTTTDTVAPIITAETCDDQSEVSNLVKNEDSPIQVEQAVVTVDATTTDNATQGGIVQEATITDDRSNCHSEEYWKIKSQCDNFQSQVEKASTEQIVFGVENEDPYLPSMLRLSSSTKSKEPSKSMPWMKKTKSTIA